MKANIRILLLVGIMLVVAAALSFGQTANQPQRVPTTVKPQTPPPPPAPAPQAAQPGTTAKARFRSDLKLTIQADGLQCLLNHVSSLKAAYAEAAQSGCKKVATEQGTLYNCGFHPSPYYDNCLAAAQKVNDIIKNCGLKPPVHQEGPPGGISIDTPGCNSLGISCLEDPA